MRVLLIDNYDSFTYNLYQYFGEIGVDAEVVRNDSESLETLLERPVRGVVISPGPGVPQDAGVSVSVVRAFAERGIPVFGVCLGHQSIGLAYGGEIVRARSIMHGKTSLIHHEGVGLMAGLPEPFEATRYHSLVIDPESCPAELEVTARTDDGEIMGVRHRELPVEGVQFHPESILTVAGKDLLRNFARRCEKEAGG